MRRRICVAVLALATFPAANSSQDRIDTSKLEWPVASDLAQYGIHLRMHYREARQRMLTHGWALDPTEVNAKYGQGPRPYPEFPEVLCGEGYDAICSGWFSKEFASRTIDVRIVEGNLVVRGSSQ